MAHPDPPSAAALLATALIVWGAVGLRLLSIVGPVVHSLLGDRCLR